MENRIYISPKGSRRVARGLLTDNWSRALAVMCISLFALTIYLLVEQLVLTLVDKAAMLSGTLVETELATVADYYAYYTGAGFRLQYIVALVLTVFYFLIVSPLKLGCVGWYQSLAQVGSLQVGQVFYYYHSNDRFTEAIIFELNRIGRHVLFGGLSLAPSIVCFGLAISRTADPGYTGSVAGLVAAGCLLLVAGFIIYMLIVLRFFLAKYLYVSERRYSIGECFKLSVRCMRGCTGQMLGVRLSFGPQFLLCLLVVPAAFIIPMFNTTMAACAQDIFDSKLSV